MRRSRHNRGGFGIPKTHHMQRPPTPNPTELAPERRDSGRATVLLASLACTVIVMLFAISNPIVDGLQQLVGWQASNPTERAWLQNPQVVDKGVHLGKQVEFNVAFGARQSVLWIERSSGRVIATGRITGRPSTVATEIAPTVAASSNAWLTISISGISVPLRVWMRS